MDKKGVLFLAIFAAIALLAFYEALFPLPALAAISRFMALSAFFLLCVSLIVGPLAVFYPARFGSWYGSRRFVGVAAFVFLALHFFLALLNNFGMNFFQIFYDMKYWIAFPAMLIFGVLALTSTDFAMRKIGFAKWKTLHRMTYPAFAFCLLHFYWTANGLFVPAGSKVFVNLAEIALFALALLAIVLQFAGFIKRAKKQ